MIRPLERLVNLDAMLEPRPRTFTVEACDRADEDGIPSETPTTESVDGAIHPMPPVVEEHAFSLRTPNVRRVLRHRDCMKREVGTFQYDDSTVLEPGQVAVPPAFPDDGLERW